jgi:hypothetical protein
MFERKRRPKKLVQAAALLLDEGETVRELVQTQVGRSALSSSIDGADGHMKRGMPEPHLLFATDRNVYATRLSGARLYKVGEVVFKVPLGEADVRADGKRKIFFEGKTFHVMGTWGSHASRFLSYVEASRAESVTSDRP